MAIMIVETILNFLKWFNILEWWRVRQQEKLEAEEHLYEMEYDHVKGLIQKMEKFPDEIVIVLKSVKKIIDTKKLGSEITERFKSNYDEMIKIIDKTCFEDGVVCNYENFKWENNAINDKGTVFLTKEFKQTWSKQYVTECKID